MMFSDVYLIGQAESCEIGIQDIKVKKFEKHLKSILFFKIHKANQHIKNMSMK